MNSYSGIVASSLTVPKMKPAVNSLENLAGSKDVAIIIRQDFALGQQILVNLIPNCINDGLQCLSSILNY